MTKKKILASQAETLVYKSVYAPVDLRQMLETVESRSRIRKVPVSQLFFGLKTLEHQEVVALLPHVTEEQWIGILDLDLWQRDRMSVGRFIYWQKYILEVLDSVASKLIRATGSDLWEIAFKRLIKVFPKDEEDEQSGEGDQGEWFETPDRNYWLLLSLSPNVARLTRALITRLYEVDPALAALLIQSSSYRTSIEIEEAAYQDRVLRLENIGFQGYYDAIEIYSPLSLESSFPRKRWRGPVGMGALPWQLIRRTRVPLILFQAFTSLTGPQEVQALMDELFWVCNRLLAADGVSAGELSEVKAGIRKAISGMNLGLDYWSKGEVGQATEGVRNHFLQSFFQLGYGRLLHLQTQAREIASGPHTLEAGSFEEAVLEGLLRGYPVLTLQVKSGIRHRFFYDLLDLQRAQRSLVQATSSEMSPKG